jgi:hypothetical protein
VVVDGVFGQAQPAADLLRAEVLVDQFEALALARGQPLDRVG